MPGELGQIFGAPKFAKPNPIKKKKKETDEGLHLINYPPEYFGQEKKKFMPHLDFSHKLFLDPSAPQNQRKETISFLKKQTFFLLLK